VKARHFVLALEDRGAKAFVRAAREIALGHSPLRNPPLSAIDAPREAHQS
jgi:hypothetical protein